jgi:DUF971 family protein
MTVDSTTPAQLKKIGKDQFQITWKDGHVSNYTYQFLRQNCPCAGCRNEWTGERTLDPNTVPSDLIASKVNIVGNYALHFAFSDHHETGIYSFNTLRSMCPCTICKEAV